VNAQQGDLPLCPQSKSLRWHNCFGTYSFHDGRKYVGEWKNDRYDGFGIYSFANGEKYVGEWIDDKRNGKGILYARDGSILQMGIWVDNKLVEEVNITPSPPKTTSVPIPAARRSERSKAAQKRNAAARRLPSVPCSDSTVSTRF
jgi:hypothetical protein